MRSARARATRCLSLAVASTLPSKRALGLAAAAISASLLAAPSRALDIHFDYTSFDNQNTPGVTPHFGQAQFNVLNYPSINGNYMMTSTDNHRPEMLANNNEFAEFYNWLQQRYDAHTTKDPVVSAQEIDSYVKSNSPSLAAPKWLILNEMSTSLWPNSATYRTWLTGLVAQLKNTHGYSVVTYTTFAGAPPGPAADWQALAANGYIGVENYLSGKEIMNNGTDYDSRKAWAYAQYVWSKTPYGNLGVNSSRLFMSEHFGNTAATYVDGSGVTRNVGWGRAGIASSDWDTVLQIRQDAILQANYQGFLAYGWSENGMLASEAEQIQHEYWYRTRRVMQSQQPQWLADNTYSVNGTSIPLSWNQQLNWLGGVPNASGAVANFYRTNTAARSITLDAAQTIGTLSFNSPSTYTITPGAGGSLSFNNNGAGANISVLQGTHVINAPITVADNLTANVTSNLSFSGTVSINAAKTLTKSGAGTLIITGTQSHSSGAAINATAGALNLNTDAGSPTSRVLFLTVTGATVNMNATQHLASLTVNPSGTATLQPGGNRLLVTSTFTAGGGRVDIGDNRMIVDYSSATPLASIRSALVSGRGGTDFANATWNGSGIKSSAAQSGDKVSFQLGYVENSFLPQLGLPSYTSFGGQSVDSNSILIRYTLGADANLDGKVNTDDVTIVGALYNNPPTGHWFLGDFDYDGVCDTDDVTVLGALYNATAPALSTAQLTAQYGAEFASAFALGQSLNASVPDPASASLFIFASTALLSRRRRSSAR